MSAISQCSSSSSSSTTSRPVSLPLSPLQRAVQEMCVAQAKVFGTIMQEQQTQLAPIQRQVTALQNEQTTMIAKMEEQTKLIALLHLERQQCHAQLAQMRTEASMLTGAVLQIQHYLATTWQQINSSTTTTLVPSSSLSSTSVATFPLTAPTPLPPFSGKTP